MNFLNKNLSKIYTALCLGSATLLSNAVHAEGKLTIYCSVQSTTCEKITQTFSKKYNVQTQFVRNSTGATLSKLKAEQNNPQADAWYGGTIELHYQAADLGLLSPYRSPKQAETMPQFKALLDKKGDLTSILYMLVLGFGVNTEKFAELGIKDYPKCWKDLLDPRLKGQIQVPDPQLSGTTYTAIVTLIELLGEEKAFEYLKQLDANVSQYMKSNQVTSNLARGESAVSVGFVHSYATEKENGAPVEAILPCEGDSYSLGGLSIIKGARNLDNAKLFVDWALSKEAQEIPWREAGVYQIPTNVNA
ncbi:ABC transporter substrate-binding protein, partial [Avibacterium endocarditidis]